MGKLASMVSPLKTDDPHFSARLVPHRSMSPRAFSFLMLALAGFCSCLGLAFWLAGAWPVVGFLGLDLLLLWLAFRYNYRSASAFEEIAVWPHDLVVRQVSAAGAVHEYRFNPFWTRFEVRRHDEIGITHMGIVARGRELAIGAFLNPDDRESFATAFGRALAAAKRG